MEGYIGFSFRLPTCLYLLESNEFNIPSEDAIIKTAEIFETSDTRFGRAQGMEIASDVDAAFRFTQLSVYVRDENPSIPMENLKRVYGSKVIALTNKFLDAHRFVTGRHAIANVPNFEVLRGFSVKRHDDDGEVGLVTVSFGAAGASLSPHKPPLSPELHDKIASLVAGNGVDLEHQLVMDAVRHASIGHEIQALISAVTALDVVLRQRPKNRPKWFFRFFHRYTPLEELVRKNLGGRIEKSNVDNVVAAIRERNKVVHAGRRSLSGDIGTYIQDIQLTIVASKL